MSVRPARAPQRGAEHVVLLHGLWMNGLALASFARRLREHDFTVHVVDYRSTTHGPAGAIESVRAKLAELGERRVHVVGHSLGGVVAIEALRGSAQPRGRAVAIGSPLRGSRSAQRLGAWPLGQWLTGAAHDLLCRGVEPWCDALEVGVIAGRVPLGLGTIMGNLPHPNDGTVTVEETKLDGIRDHVVVASTHTGLVYSDEVAALVARFLREGRFAAPGHGRSQ